MSDKIFYGFLGFCRELGFHYLKEGNTPHGFIKVNAARELREAMLQIETAGNWVSLGGQVTPAGATLATVPGDGGGRLLVNTIASHREIATEAFILSRRFPDRDPLSHWCSAERRVLERSVDAGPIIVAFPSWSAFPATVRRAA